MRVTLDSNAWEKIFDPVEPFWLPIRDALGSGQLQGFICEIGFKIEAIPKRDRPAYFSQPLMEVQFPFDMMVKDGKSFVRIASIGPDDKRHPGLPEVQAGKLREALTTGVRLLRGSAWMGLPVPSDIREPALFASTAADREQRQIDACAAIETRGIGKAAFDAVGGWDIVEGGAPTSKAFQKACAEWADGEMVAAHIAYRNDVLCTNDHGRSTGLSVLDATNRAWLSATFGVRFMTLEDLRPQVLDVQDL